MTCTSRPYRTRSVAAFLSIAALFSLGAAKITHAEVYTWTDKQGNVHITDDLAKIPPDRRPAGSHPASEVGEKYPSKPRPVTPVPDREKEQEIGITIIDYGLFQVKRLGRIPDGPLDPSMLTVGNANTVRLLEKTDQVPAVLGTKFGIRYRVTGGKQGDTVEIETRVLIPGMRKTTVDGPRAPVPDPAKFTTSWRFPKTIGSITYDGYVFERDWELVPGTWVIQFYHNGIRLAEKSFDVYAQKETLNPRVPAEIRREIEKLNSSDCSQRLSAVRQLEDMGTKAAPAVPALVRTLQYYSLPNQVAFDCGSGKAAPRCLARIGQPALKPLIEALGEPEWNIRAGAKESLVTMGKKAVPALIKALQKDTDPAICVGAAETLGEIRDPRVTGALIDAVTRNPWPQVRGKSAEVLAKRKERRAIKPLVVAYRKPGENWHVRYDVLNALVVIAGKEEVRKLIPDLFEEKDPEIREAIASLFSGLTDSSARTFYQQGLSDKNAVIRKSALQAQEKTGNERSFEALVVALKDKSWEVRTDAAMALGRLGDKRAVDPLIDALRDPNRAVVVAAEYALGQQKDAKAVEPLLALLQDPARHKNDSDMRAHAIRALGAIGDPRTVKPILALVRDQNSSLRGAARESLGGVQDRAVMVALADILAERRVQNRLEVKEPLARMGPPVIPILFDTMRRERGNVDESDFADVFAMIGEPAVEPLIQGLNDYYPKKAAAQALGRIKDPRAIAPLIATLKDQNVNRESAAALGAIGAPAVPPLLEMTKTPDVVVRRQVILALAHSRDPRAVDALFSALGDDDATVRSSAAEGLGNIPGKQAVPALIRALGDSSSTTRINAAEALGKTGDKRAVEPLLRLVKTDTYSRSTAIRSLGNLKDKRATKTLIPYLQDQDQQLRWAAVDALGVIGDRTALPALARTLDDKDQTVKYAAWAALRKISGKDFGPERADWEAWMKRHGDAAAQP